MKFLILAAFIPLIGLLSVNVHAQESKLKKFAKISTPEKVWVLSHPFVAKKTLSISNEAIEATKKVMSDTLLDGDKSGGQVDAFRHCYWMARMTQEMNWRKAYSLGKAHEKGNWRDYKKHRLEEGILPDAPSCEMDLRNNKKGIEIGRTNRDIPQDSLIAVVKQNILDGNLWKIRKDKNGEFLDCNGKPLRKEDYQGVWDNGKCLVPSNE